MNVDKALASGSEGMMFTIVSVFGTLALGWLFGRKLLGVDSQTSYLLSSGTAICGGSAIAAVGPIIKARAESMSVALGVVFILNAIALFVFPIIGDALSMTMKQFGMWAAKPSTIPRRWWAQVPLTTRCIPNWWPRRA